ncbi:MAG TPA: glycosyltransferase family 1 protein [Opitutaceae bacterium]
MKITAFVHPRRCAHPLGGVGRHASEMLRELGRRSGVNVEMLVSKQCLSPEGGLENDSALPALPIRTFPLPENLAERCWKTIGWPGVDQWAGDADWIYSPMETCLPTRRVPVAITIHDVQAFETNLPWSHTAHHRRWRAKWSVWIRKALRNSRVVFTVSEFSKNRIVDLLGGDPERIVVVGNGVGPEFFGIERRPPPDGVPCAIVLGGLRVKKGGAAVIAVARELQSRRTQLRIVTVGLNDPELVEQARDVGSINVCGPVTEDGMHRLLGGASSLLFLSPYEGFGLPVLEAMAAGVPVVAANRASLPEAMGDAGILVEPDATTEIADILIELGCDTVRRESLVVAGRRRATSFTWERCADFVLGALKKHA